jgi:hypothetical protein
VEDLPPREVGSKDRAASATACQPTVVMPR